MKLDQNDATSIEKVNNLFANSKLEFNLIYIKSNFRSLPNSLIYKNIPCCYTRYRKIN